MFYSCHDRANQIHFPKTSIIGWVPLLSDDALQFYTTRVKNLLQILPTRVMHAPELGP